MLIVSLTKTMHLQTCGLLSKGRNVDKVFSSPRTKNSKYKTILVHVENVFLQVECQ